MNNRFAVGVIAGGILAAAGFSYVLNDKKTYNKIVRTGKKMASKAGTALDVMADDVEKIL